MDNKKDLLATLYDDLGNNIMRVNRGVIAALALCEIVFFFTYRVTGRMGVDWWIHLLWYFVRPMVLAIVVYCIGKMFLMKHETVKGFSGLFTLQLLMAVVIYCHYAFPALYLAVGVPIVLAVIFNSRGLIKWLFWASEIDLILVFGLSHIDPYTNCPDRFYYNMLCAIVGMVFCYYFAKHLLKYEHEKGNIIDEYREEVIKINKEACLDGLTRLYNFKTLSLTAEDWIKTKKHVAFCIIDIDNFKKVNDTYGHEFGNVVLKRLSLLLGYLARDNVFVARYGGEEFGILTNNMTMKAILAMVNKLRRTFRVEEYRETRDMYTFSGGVAFYKEGMAVTDLFEEADKKLYEAKHNGKNQIAS